MRAAGTFTVVAFEPAEVTPARPVATALPVSAATMEKTFTGEIDGRSTTLFTSAFDQGANVGTYLAMESFEGSVAGKRGSFNFVHSATTRGTGREADYFRIVPSSGTGDLADITGTGALEIAEDGTHHIWFDYEL